MDVEKKINKVVVVATATATSVLPIRNYILLILLSFLNGCDFAAVIPSLWERLNVDYDANGAFFGLVLSAYSFSEVIFGCFAVKKVDCVQRTKYVYLFCIQFAIYGHALYFLGISKYFILAARLVTGLTMAAFTIAIVVELARCKNEKERMRKVCVLLMARTFGVMLSPVFNLFLREFNFTLFDLFICDRKSAPGFFMCLVWLVYFFIFLIFFKDVDYEKTKAVQKRAKFKLEFFRRSEIILLLVSSFFIQFIQSSVETIITPLTKELLYKWTDFTNSIIFSTASVAILVSFSVVQLVRSRVSDRCTLLFGLFCLLVASITGSVTLALSEQTVIINEAYYNDTEKQYGDNFQTTFNGALLFLLFYVIALPAVLISSVSLLAKLLHKDFRGLGQTIQRSCFGLGAVIGPICSGPFVDSFAILFLIQIVVVTFIILHALVSFDKLRRIKTNQSKTNQQNAKIFIIQH